MCGVLDIEPRASHVLGGHSLTELCHQPYTFHMTMNNSSILFSDFLHTLPLTSWFSITSHCPVCCPDQCSGHFGILRIFNLPRGSELGVFAIIRPRIPPMHSSPDDSSWKALLKHNISKGNMFPTTPLYTTTVSPSVCT